MKDAFVWCMVVLLIVDFVLRGAAAHKKQMSTGDLVAFIINGGMLVFGLTAALL